MLFKEQNTDSITVKRRFAIFPMKVSVSMSVVNDYGICVRESNASVTIWLAPYLLVKRPDCCADRGLILRDHRNTREKVVYGFADLYKEAEGNSVPFFSVGKNIPIITEEI